MLIAIGDSQGRAIAKFPLGGPDFETASSAAGTSKELLLTASPRMNEVRDFPDPRLCPTARYLITLMRYTLGRLVVIERFDLLDHL